MEIARAVVWLASPEASYVTGTVLAVDGGHAPTGATAVRPSWHELPEPLREGLATRLGRIVSAEIQTGGFTPSRAWPRY